MLCQWGWPRQWPVRYELISAERCQNSAVTDPTDAAPELRELATRIEEISTYLDYPEARQELEDVVTHLRILLIRHFGRKPNSSSGAGARATIRDHLNANVGRWIEGEEIAAVSGIQEWARRIRELRVEEGFDIEEQGGRYCLHHAEPDRKTAAHWEKLHAIRQTDGGARDRILTLFKACVGEVLTRDEIDYVGKIKEGSRRLRELRDEFGWPIESHIDDPLLQPGQYRLVSADDQDLKDPRQRLYPEDLRAEVFTRDNYTCQKCHRNHQSAQAAGDRRFYLEIHHRTAVAEELDALPADQLNSPENLVTYCHACHRAETADFHRERREQRRARYPERFA